MATTLTPYLGKDFKTIKEARASWARGDDWVIASPFHQYGGKPVNINSGAPDTFALRFCKLTKICKAV